MGKSDDAENDYISHMNLKTTRREIWLKRRIGQSTGRNYKQRRRAVRIRSQNRVLRDP